MKSVVIQQVYPNMGFLPLIQEQFVRNTNYCEKFDLDYKFISAVVKDPIHGGWDKVFRVAENLDYDFVVWLDADTLIHDINKDLREVPIPPDSIGMVEFGSPVPHLNVGVMYVKPGPRVERLFGDWIGGFPGSGAWHEQAVFNSIKNECVVSIPNTWNRNYDHNPYSNPVVMGFHGYGSALNRLNLMRTVLDGK